MESRYYLFQVTYEPDVPNNLPEHWPETIALVDNDAGGIVAYISGWDRAEKICSFLNTSD
jgi:hypothetical protein